MNQRTAHPSRPLIVLVCVVAAIVVVALVVVLSRGTPRLLDGSTPAGVVQRYSAAVIAGDEITAKTYLSSSVTASCGRSGVAVPDNIRVALVSTTERAESADVKVSITLSYENGPFGVSEDSVEAAFDLVKENGMWRIDTAPGMLAVCANTGVMK